MSRYDNEEGVVLASGSRSGTVNSPDIYHVGGIGALSVTVNVTANAGGLGSLLVGVDGKDPASGVYYNLLTSAAITATGLVVLRINPFVPGVANSIVQLAVPKTFRITTVGNANPMTYSIGYILTRD